jgi:hypothetical protein
VGDGAQPPSHRRSRLVEVLLAAGADPAIKDTRFEATALGWARHFEHPDLVAVLERITPEDSA